MPIGWDETAPADTASIPAFPANERAQRAAVKAFAAVEHDSVEGRHKFPFGLQAVQDALTNYVDGTLFFLLNTSGKMQLRFRYAALGGWRDVVPPSEYADRTLASAWTAYQYVTPVTVTPTGGPPANISISAATSAAKKVTLTGDSIVVNPSGYTANVYTTVSLEVFQDGTGGHELTFSTDYIFAGGVVPLIASAANARSLITLTQMSDGKWFAALAPDLRA